MFSAAYSARCIANSASAGPTYTPMPGYFEEDTGNCYPLYRKYDACADPAYSYVYFDPSNPVEDIPVTATNFTATKPQKSGPYLAYETLANGAVEKLNRFVTIDAAGVPISEFYQFGTDVAYTPVDTTRVEPRPIKEQMAQGTIAVTDTAAGFVAVSGIVPVANSEGENFPAHGIFHVNADADGAGAGIAYTTDGTDPANSATAVELEVGTGQSFELDTWEEIANLTMIAIDNTGDPNATATDVDVSFELNNIAPGKDDI